MKSNQFHVVQCVAWLIWILNVEDWKRHHKLVNCNWTGAVNKQQRKFTINCNYHIVQAFDTFMLCYMQFKFNHRLVSKIKSTFVCCCFFVFFCFEFLFMVAVRNPCLKSAWNSTKIRLAYSCLKWKGMNAELAPTVPNFYKEFQYLQYTAIEKRPVKSLKILN